MKFRSFLQSSVIIVAMLVLWQISEDLVNQSRYLSGETSLELFFPTPRTIVWTFFSRGNIILIELGHTLFKAFLGLLLGIFFAMVIAVLFIMVPKARSIVMPITQGINSFPVVGFSPIIILVFGQGSWMGIVFISALIAYFPTLIALDHSIRTINNEWVSLMKVWGATKWQVFLKLQLPNAIPFLTTSLKLAIPASIIGAVLGEWLGTRNGVGKLITLSFYQLDPGMVYAALISLMLVSLTATLLVSYAEKKLFPWR
jgi:putative hydroxymethylpyrimidine transport system permease protein